MNAHANSHTRHLLLLDPLASSKTRDILPLARLFVHPALTIYSGRHNALQRAPGRAQKKREPFRA